MLKKKTLKKPFAKAKKPVNKNTEPITQKALKEAYQLVRSDLFKRLVKANNNETIWLPNIGTFTKRKQQTTSGFDNETYLYWKIGFRMSATLKRELEKSL